MVSHTYGGREVPRSAFSKLVKQESCGIVPSRLWRSENQESKWYKFVCVHVWRQKKTNVPAWRQAKRVNFSFFLSLLFYSGLQIIGWGPLILGRKICYVNLQIQMLVLSMNTFMDTPRIMFNQKSGHPMAQPNWHIKLTTTNIAAPPGNIDIKSQCQFSVICLYRIMQFLVVASYLWIIFAWVCVVI